MGQSRARSSRHRGTAACGWVLLLALVVVGDPLAGQLAPGARVSGLVLEAGTPRPVDMASVRLAGEPGTRGGTEASPSRPIVRSTRTDQEGRYGFKDVPAGTYRLTVARLGYRTSTLWLSVPSSTSLRRSVELELDPVLLDSLHVAGTWDRNSLIVREGDRPDGVTVPSGPRRHGGSPGLQALDAHTLSREEIRWRSRSALGEPDVFRALQRLPGVSARSDYSAELWTRGSPWGMTAVLLDGIPVYDPLHMGGVTSSLPVEALESAIFHAGVRPASLSHGAAGAVNLVTRRAGDVPVRGLAVSPASVSAHWDDRRVEDRVGLSLTARRSWWDWLEAPMSLAGGGSSGRIDYYFTDLTGRLDVRLPAGITLEAGGLRAEDRLDGDIRRVVGDAKGSWKNRVGWVGVERAWDDRLRVRTKVGRTSHSAVTRSKAYSFLIRPDGVPTLDWTELDVAQTLIRLTAQGRVPEGALTWELGLERARETLSQEGMEAYDRRAPGLNAPATLGRSRAWAQVGLERSNVLFSTGLAWDVPFEGDPPGMGPLPNMRVRVMPHNRLHVEAAWGRSAQTAYPLAQAGRSIGPALDVGQVWMLAGGDLPPLIADVGTLNVEATLPLGFGVRAAAWQRDFTGVALNGVVTIREGRIATLAHDGQLGRGQGQGLEVSLWRRAGRLSGNMSYTRSRSEIIAPEGDKWSSPAERKHSVNLDVTGRATEAFRGSIFLTWESGWPFSHGPWACRDRAFCAEELEDPLRPTSHSFHRATPYRSVDLQLDWDRPGARVDWGVSASLLNVASWKNASAYRPEGCGGRALVSVVCTYSAGMAWLAPGLGGPTPAIALRAVF